MPVGRDEGGTEAAETKTQTKWGKRERRKEQRMKRMAHLDSIFKSRDITLPAKISLVKAVVFPVVMCGCAAADAKLRQLCSTL